MSDDVILKTPRAAEPFTGKAALRPVVEALLGVVDTFEFHEIVQGPKHTSSFFSVTAGAVLLDGMDYWGLDDQA